MRPFATVLCALLPVFAPTLASAQSACQVDTATWWPNQGATLEGTWTGSSNLFLMNGEDMGMSFTDQVEVEHSLGGLMLNGDEFETPITVALTERNINITPPQGITDLTGEEFEILLGCDVNSLPRLTSEQAMVFDGVTANVRYTVVVAAYDRMEFWFNMDTAMGNILQYWTLTRS